MNPGLPERCRACSARCAEGIAFLSGLSPEREEKIMERAVRRRLLRGSLVFSEGEETDGIFTVLDGTVRLGLTDAGGREQTVGIFSAGDVFCESFPGEEKRCPYDAVCLSDCTVCRIPGHALEEAISDPEVSLRLIGVLARKLRDANERIHVLTAGSPRARIAGFLLSRTRQEGSDTVVLRLEDIASSISLRHETVSRRLKEMEREGLIEKTGQSAIRILKREELERIFRE